MKTVGFNIRRAREAKGLSQEDAAHLAHMNIRNYQRLEAGEGNPTLATLLSLAEALEISLDAMAGRSEKAKAAVGPAAKPGPNGWIDAARVLTSLAQVGPVRRLAVLYLLTQDPAYLDALRDLPGSAPVLRLLETIR